MIKEVEAGKFIESATFSGNMYGKVLQSCILQVYLI